MTDGAADNRDEATGPLPRRPFAESHPETIPLAAAGPLNCPNCGKPLPGDDSVVCVSCGYDLRSVQIRPTIIQSAEVRAAGTGQKSDTESRQDLGIDPSSLPLLRPFPNWRVCVGVAAACAIVMIAAYLAGYGGLFPTDEGRFADATGAFTADAPIAAARLMGVAKFLLFRLVLLGCGLLALNVHSHLRGIPTGSLRGVAAAMAAVVSVAGLMMLLSMSNRAFEHFVEIVGQGALAVLVMLGLFRLKPTEALLVIGIGLLVVVFAVLGAHVIVWAT